VSDASGCNPSAAVAEWPIMRSFMRTKGPDGDVRLRDGSSGEEAEGSEEAMKNFGLWLLCVALALAALWFSGKALLLWKISE
jgi:hypothetical protein